MRGDVLSLQSEIVRDAHIVGYCEFFYHAARPREFQTAFRRLFEFVLQGFIEFLSLPAEVTEKFGLPYFHIFIVG